MTDKKKIVSLGSSGRYKTFHKEKCVITNGIMLQTGRFVIIKRMWSRTDRCGHKRKLCDKLEDAVTNSKMESKLGRCCDKYSSQRWEVEGTHTLSGIRHNTEQEKALLLAKVKSCSLVCCLLKVPATC